MRLRLVYQGNFTKNEATLFEEAMKENKGVHLGPDDCVLLVSRSGKILKFVFRPEETSYVRFNGKNGKMTTVLESETYRITGPGRWNPLLLANYAKEVDIDLENVKKFEQHYKALLTA